MQHLQAEIERRFGTVHRFCREHPELNRATVYMLLAGTYGGNTERQAERIRDALGDNRKEKQVFEAIKQAACARCHFGQPCSRCDSLFKTQTDAAMKVFSS